MRKFVKILFILFPGFIMLNSCALEDGMKPKETPLVNVQSNNQALLSSALKFEAVHQVPFVPGGEMPMPELVSITGNRFRFKAPAMTVFSNVEPSEASEFLFGGTLIAELEAFWKIPNSDPL